MGIYEDSHWVQGRTARIHNVLSSSVGGAIDFSWNGSGHVGWRQLWHEPLETVAPLVTHALIAWRDQYDVFLRVTNDGAITDIQTAGLQRHDPDGRPIDECPTLGQIIDVVTQIVRHYATDSDREPPNVGQRTRTGHGPGVPPIPHGRLAVPFAAAASDVPIASPRELTDPAPPVE